MQDLYSEAEWRAEMQKAKEDHLRVADGEWHSTASETAYEKLQRELDRIAGIIINAPSRRW